MGICSVLYQKAFALFMRLVEREYVPDFILRRGIRFLLSKRLQEVQTSSLGLLRHERLARSGALLRFRGLPGTHCHRSLAQLLTQRLRRRISRTRGFRR